MKNPEFQPAEVQQNEHADESGYSEKKQVKARESQFDLPHQQRAAGGTQQKAMIQTKNNVKTLARYHEISAKLAQLINQYAISLEDDLRRAKKLLAEINDLEKQRKELFKILLS